MPSEMAKSLSISKKMQSPVGGHFNPIRALARPDEWALNMELRVDGRPFTLEGREYIRQVIRDTSDEIVIPKAAQTAFTVTFLVRTLQWITERRWNHLYLLPLKTGAIPFVQARIDPMIDASPYLRGKFKTVDNRLHKQAEGINLYIRGTNIDRELQEIPVDCEVWDERDRMVEDNLEDARHRMDGSEIQKLTILSTPTVPGHGVDSEDAWWASDQHRWEIPCPGCSRYQVLNFEDNLKLGDKAEDCVLECAHCHHNFVDGERRGLNKDGRWVPQNPDGKKRGYHVSQFNSPTQPLEKIVEGYFLGQSNARKLRSFYNNSLGIPYVAHGDQLTPEILDKCILPGYTMGGIPDSAIYIGIDVGATIHVTAYTKFREQFKLWDMKILREWNEVDNYLSRLSNFMCVCDAHPEKRAARDLSLKYQGRFWLGFEMDRPQTQEIAVWHPQKIGEAGKVVIDRTMAFDQVIKDFLDGNVILPPNARELGEHMPKRPYNGYYAHMTQMVRVEEEDLQGRIVAKWKKNRNPDHWHHSAMFARIAAYQQPSLVIPTGISEAFDRAGSLVDAA